MCIDIDVFVYYTSINIPQCKRHCCVIHQCSACVFVCVGRGGGGAINDQCDPHLVITRSFVCTNNFNYGSKNRET